MMTVTTVCQMLVRLTGLLLIVLGVLFWTGHAEGLIPVHMLIGLVLVLSLWVLSAIAARAGVQPGLVALTAVWGLIVVIFGLEQTGMLPGSAHWVIQVLHLLIGLAAIGLGEAVGARTKKGLARPAGQQSTA